MYVHVASRTIRSGMNWQAIRFSFPLPRATRINFFLTHRIRLTKNDLTSRRSLMLLFKSCICRQRLLPVQTKIKLNSNQKKKRSFLFLISTRIKNFLLRHVAAGHIAASSCITTGSRGA